MADGQMADVVSFDLFKMNVTHARIMKQVQPWRQQNRWSRIGFVDSLCDWGQLSGVYMAIQSHCPCTGNRAAMYLYPIPRSSVWAVIGESYDPRCTKI